jgi:hypothetical protein
MRGMWRHGKATRSGGQLNVSRAPWAAAVTAGAALFTSLSFAPALAVQPTYSFRSPFDPQQCDLATRAGQAAVRQKPESMKARLLLAEGLLCAGLDGNPFALEDAVAQLRDIVAEDPANLYAQLEYADALRKQFPASVEAYSTLVRVRRTLKVADIGAARPDLGQYIAENLGAIRDQRARNAEFLLPRESHAADGTLPKEEALRAVALLAEMGAHGRRRAEKLIGTIAARGEETGALKLMRVDLLIPRLEPEHAVALYSEAAAHACAGAESDACSMVQQRLANICRWVSNIPGACAPLGR